MDEPIRHPLAYARFLRGWSQNDLVGQLRQAARRRPEGLRCGVDKPAVSRWEHGRKKPDTESQLLLADAFDVPISDLERYPWPHWLPGREDPVPLGSAYTVHSLRDAQRAVMDRERRTFLTYSALALAGLATQWAALEPGRLATAADGGTRVDGELMTWLEETGAKLAALPTEQRQHTVKLTEAHLDTVTDLLERGRFDERTGRRLHLLASSLASTCGWYRFDQGQHYAAGKFWSAALSNAHTAQDRDQGAGVLADFAYQAIWLGRPDAAVEPLGQALVHTRHPVARATLRLRRARAHAAMGDAGACHDDLKAAEAALSAGRRDPAPSWCRWMSTADLSVDSGQCMLDLGRTDDARVRIGEGLSLLPRSRDKTRGVFRTYEARSLIRAGEVEQALAVSAESLDLAQRIGADRCVALVRDLGPEFRPYTAVDGVRDFLERLRSCGARREG
ncbi:helix-turn-helix transcriptional regulator [Streptomyces andamanensis]|uniref:Helix-turn-helix transcriptional regulator n=1 Tax=Streptomyces andamanensis TaxID=1565035 RepID=A0ABV8TMQ4_9ACTN